MKELADAGYAERKRDSFVLDDRKLTQLWAHAWPRGSGKRNEL